MSGGVGPGGKAEEFPEASV